MSEDSKVIHILVGLPGSGKTTWAFNYMNSFIGKGGSGRYGIPVKVVICDNYIESAKEDRYPINSIEDILERAAKYDSYEKYNEIVLDGLFLNNKPIKDAITWIVKHINYMLNDRYAFHSSDYKNDIDYTIKLHIWEPNIEYCLHNDEGRRAVNSAFTIKNAKLEYNISDLEREFPEMKFEVEHHKTVWASSWDKFKAKYGRDYYGRELEYITSGSWTTGGTWANCWGNEGTCAAEPEDDFETLDDILAVEFPNISYLQFKELKKKYIELEEWGDNDYYGGCEYKAQWKIKVRDLYDFLVEKGQIKED